MTHDRDLYKIRATFYASENTPVRKLTHNWHIRSAVFNNIENPKTQGKMHCNFHICLQFLMHYVLAIYARVVCINSCTVPCKMSGYCCPQLRTRQAMYGKKCNIEACLCNHCWGGTEISTAHFECVFIHLRIQHAMSMRLIVICGLPALPCFSTLSHKRQDFRRNIIEHKMGVLMFSANCLKHSSF